MAGKRYLSWKVWGFPISTVMALMPSCAAAPRNEPSGPVLLMAKGGECEKRWRMWRRGVGGGPCNALHDNLRVLEEGHSPGHGVVHVRTHVKRIDTPKGRRVQICAWHIRSGHALKGSTTARMTRPRHDVPMRYSNFLTMLWRKRLAKILLQLGAPEPGNTRFRSAPSLNPRELLM